MGKGDKKTKRGKINIGSYGKLRPKRKKFNVRPAPVKDAQEKEA
ncbi:30S ribosomal protein THX [Aequorivita capsosiphonis]|nr:30S ribosomal protein THX [Aequorivita capsosiphonis]